MSDEALLEVLGNTACGLVHWDESAEDGCSQKCNKISNVVSEMPNPDFEGWRVQPHNLSTTL